MLGATEFTFIGNVLMGVMAIGGLGAMLYAVGRSLTGTSAGERRIAGRRETSHGTFKKAA
ncbi:MAG: hypothetical protein EPO02_04050 [Nitrospirae bacterium]|nr:MAG: hypothetical protein EPO02_04050 [Nitrospirota bacterium]